MKPQKAASSPLRGTNSGASIPEEEGTTGHGNSPGIKREEGDELMGLHLNFPLTTPLPFVSKPLPSLGSGSTVCPAGALCLSTMGSSSSTQHHFAFQNAEKGMWLFWYPKPLLCRAETLRMEGFPFHLLSSGRLELGCSLAVTTRALSTPAELMELRWSQQSLLSPGLSSLHTSG